MLSPLRSLLLGLALAGSAAPTRALEPFVASYQAYNEGKLAGAAKMQVVQTEGERWRVDLGIRGTRGFARLAGLNIEQQAMVVETDPGLCSPVAGGWGHKGWTSLYFDSADSERVRDLIGTAWRNVAPKKLVAASFN